MGARTDIESKITDALAEVVEDLQTVPVICMSVASQDRPRTYILCKAGVPKRRSTNSPIYDITIDISCVASSTDSKTPDYVTQIAEPVEALLSDWDGDIDSVCDDLQVDSFRVDGFSMTGNPAEYDSGLTVWFQTFSVVVSGVILSTQEETET